MNNFRITTLYFLHARNLDELTPWLFLLSTMALSLLFLFHISGNFLLQHAERGIAHTSHIEIRLADVPRPTASTTIPRIMPKMKTGGKLVTAKKGNKVVDPTMIRKKELAAYLVQWQDAILKVAQEHLAKGKIPPGRIIVYLTLNPQGEILRIRCVSTNHDLSLELAVKSIIVDAEPFPPLPSFWQNPPQNLRIARTWTFQ